MEIEEMIKSLSEKTRGGVDLRFSGGRFAVMVPFGNVMVAVPGCVRDSAREALAAALERWEARSPERPFIPGTD